MIFVRDQIQVIDCILEIQAIACKGKIQPIGCKGKLQPMACILGRPNYEQENEMTQALRDATPELDKLKPFMGGRTSISGESNRGMSPNVSG